MLKSVCWLHLVPSFRVLQPVRFQASLYFPYRFQVPPPSPASVPAPGPVLPALPLVLQVSKFDLPNLTPVFYLAQFQQLNIKHCVTPTHPLNLP